MQEVEMKYKAELTAQLREEYGISKMVPVPVNNPISPAPPANSNFGFSTIKTDPLDPKDLANPLKKLFQQKGTWKVLAQICLLRKGLPVQQNLRIL